MTLQKWTSADFDQMSWHDCNLWRLDLRLGNPDEQDWTCELVLGLDYITEWICGTDERCRFHIAPARLVFHDVSAPRIHLDWQAGNHQMMMSQLSILELCREPLNPPRVRPDEQRYAWTIELDHPPKGEILFGASGFTQTLLAEPVLRDEQYLYAPERERLIRGEG